MKAMTFCVFLAASLTLASSAAAQVSSVAPSKWISATSLDGFTASRIQLSNNTPGRIHREVLDTNTVRFIAETVGLTAEDLDTVQIAPSLGQDGISLYRISGSEKTFKALGALLKSYIQGRQEGHTKAFLLAAIAERTALPTLDPERRVLATNRSLIALSWLKKSGSGTKTNKAGSVVRRSTQITIVNGKWVTNETTYIPKTNEICHWVSYAVVDGEIGWHYFVQAKADGSLDYVHDSKSDAKELDPNYSRVIAEVKDEVDAIMKREGTYGHFGSVHRSWHLKKEKLKARGIEWRSPAELNPGTNYD